MEMSLMHSVDFAHAQTAVPCNVCEDEVPGEYYCKECKQTLCPQCERNHRRVAATKHHTIVLRAQIDDIDTTTLTCADHEEPASCHCETCNIAVCIDCVTGKHRGHEMVDLNEIFEKEKTQLQDDINKIQKDALPKLKQKSEKIRIEKGKYEAKIKQIRKDMKDEYHNCIALVTKIYNDRINDLGTIRDTNMTNFDCNLTEILTKIKSCEEKIVKSENAIKQRNMKSMARLAKIEIPLSGIDSTTKLPDPPSFIPGNVQSTGDILGKVSKPLKLATPTIVSRFKSPLKGDPSIFITREGNIWLGGNESKELVSVDIKGQVLRRRTIQNRPSALAVMDCGDVIIIPRSDDPTVVSKLLRDGKIQYLYATQLHCLNGGSVTADQKILICTLDGRVVRVNGDGYDVKEIYKGSGDNSTYHAVEKLDDYIYVSDFSNHAVVMVSIDGEVKSTITHTTEEQQIGGPLGLVVDKMDSILCADSDNNCVYIIDQDQQMRELVGPSHGINNPQWLAVDKDNNLWITQKDGTVHVVKYLSR